MTFPLMVLAFFSAVGGLFGIPHLLGHPIHVSHFLAEWLSPMFPEIHGTPEGIFEIPGGAEAAVMVVSTLVAIAGWWIAKSLYGARALEPDQHFAERHAALQRSLENKYYVDEMYDAAVVRPLNQISVFFWKGVDAVIDGLLSLGAYIIAALGDLMRFFQTGNVRNYALMFFLGVILFIWLYV